MLALAILFGLGAVGLYTWGIVKLVGEKKKAGWILAGATAVLLFLFVPTITDIVNDTGERAAEDTEQVTDTESSSSPSDNESKYVEGIGTLTVVKDIYPEETITLDQMSTTVNAIKIFRVDNPEGSFKADIERYKGEPIGDTFYYMTINFTGDNTSLMNLEWYGLASVSLDDGTWLNQEDDDMFVGEDVNGNPITPDYYGETSKEYTQMYVIDNPDVNAVDLEFDAVTGASSGAVFSPSKTVTYQFD